MLWFQGWENAPALVKKCKDTWVEHHPDWTIHLLTAENLSAFIDLEAILPGYRDKTMPPEALSNMVRLSLLAKYGGVWADSTLYCNQPLNDWLPEALAGSRFFAFANPGPDRMLSNWFLAADPDHVIIQKWLVGCVNYWVPRTERHTYFWCHYTFGELYETDKTFKEQWDNTPKISADLPHYFLPYELTFYRKLQSADLHIIDHPPAPVFKLSHRVDLKKITKKSVLHYLLSDKTSPKNNHWLGKFLSKLFI